ncbi:MAG: D-aminoacylase [Lachnospiraceae bacterium]|nr:D-aminoacylase [Lachnospiraceae bacterium]
MFDYGIENGLIMDGSGEKAYRGNVYMKDGLIACISSEKLEAREVYDAAGHAVAPGFIDIHTHSDLSPVYAPNFESFIHQGVTSNIAGNCGSSTVPNVLKPKEEAVPSMSSKFNTPKNLREFHANTVGEYLEKVTGICANNQGILIGHGALRNCCMAQPKAEIPTPEELEKMKALLRQGLEEGAFGLSLGLVYVPGTYCRTEELVELAKVVAEYGATVSVHMRNESVRIYEAMDELAEIARRSGAHMHISHFKKMYAKEDENAADTLLAKYDALRAEGLDITADQYPYIATSASLNGLLGNEFRKKTLEQQLAVLGDDEAFDRELKDIIAKDIEFRGGAGRIKVAYTKLTPEYDGLFLSEVAEKMGLDPVHAYQKLEYLNGTTAQGNYFAMVESDVEKIASRKDIPVVSDGSGMDFISTGLKGLPHPRNCGSFACFLRMNREKGLMTTEEAVYRMTKRPAEIMHIDRRGELKVGFHADIVVFDPETVRDNGTYEKPGQIADGFDRVLINGVTVWADRKFTGAHPGEGMRPNLK